MEKENKDPLTRSTFEHISYCVDKKTYNNKNTLNQ
tara:strand:+ start:638 stop:742 length:105 start_codon:yes stop_codon:yes gene_type:complete